MIVLVVFVINWVPKVCPNVCPLFLLVLFRAGGKTPDPKLQVRSYMDVMKEQHLTKEEVRCPYCLWPEIATYYCLWL